MERVRAKDFLTYPVGQIFLRLLFMIVIPLVFASVTLGVASLGDLSRVGRIGGKSLGFFLFTTALAATMGLVLINLAAPGEALDPAYIKRTDGMISELVWLASRLK